MLVDIWSCTSTDCTLQALVAEARSKHAPRLQCHAYLIANPIDLSSCSLLYFFVSALQALAAEARSKNAPRLQCHAYRLLLPNLGGIRPSRPVPWVRAVMRAIVRAKVWDDAVLRITQVSQSTPKC